MVDTSNHIKRKALLASRSSHTNICILITPESSRLAWKLLDSSYI